MCTTCPSACSKGDANLELAVHPLGVVGFCGALLSVPCIAMTLVHDASREKFQCIKVVRKLG